MIKAILIVVALLLASGQAMAQQPVVVGEWAGDCAGGYRIGYRLEPDGTLTAYTVNNGVAALMGKPVYRAEGSGYFTLNFNDGGPLIVWKVSGDTIRPWRTADGSIKDGFRGSEPTSTFRRCVTP
jgi:hypothetical protein